MVRMAQAFQDVVAAGAVQRQKEMVEQVEEMEVEEHQLIMILEQDQMSHMPAEAEAALETVKVLPVLAVVVALVVVVITLRVRLQLLIQALEEEVVEHREVVVEPVGLEVLVVPVL